MIEVQHLELGEGQAPAESRPAPDPSRGHPALDDIRERWKSLNDKQTELEFLERAVIEDALAACHGIVALTARMLEVPRTGLISRMGRLDIDAEKFKERRG